MNRTAILLAAALLWAACASQPAAAPKKAAAPAAQAVKPTEDEAPAQPSTMYVYSPVGKRDPFQNVFGATQSAPVRVEGRKPTPLQRWSLDQLRLSLTVTGTSSPMAMLEDPENRGWPVRLGDFVGKNWGKVTSIQRDAIVVTETITDHSTGRVYPQNIKLTVRESAAEIADMRALKDGEEMGPSSSQGGK
jgi:type IV pilus assembly protein PilP